MKKLLALLCLASAAAFGQTSRVDGTVTDPTGASIPGADVTVTLIATDQVFKTTTNERGEWILPSMPAAEYKVVVTKSGFKSGVVPKVGVNAGVPATVNLKLEIGAATETVEVVGGAEIVQASSAAVSSTIGARQIFELPFATRNAVELLVTQPGVQTPTNPRSSSVNGLPRGALNVTIDGMNTQDNMLKSSDGFFSYVYPSVDSLDELTVTTSAGAADSSGQGAAQIKFTTKSGSNQFHGGGFYQRRQTGWNSNYYFNNQQGLQRDVVKLTQRGLHGGGPFKKDKAFFFVNYEQYLLPGTKSYTRQILTDSAANGNFTYNGGGQVRTVNLYQIAAAGGFTSTPDPRLLKTFQDMNATASKGVTQQRIASNNDYNRLDLNYQPDGNQTRNFLTTRLDYNITSNHHLSFVYNYDKYDSTPDFLNNVVAAFPGTGTTLGSTSQTGQLSNRFAGTLSLRSQFGSHVTNEWRGGLNGGTVLFFPGMNAGQLAPWGGYRPIFGSTYVSGVTTATSAQRRNSPVKDIADNIYYIRGSHQFSFGGTFTQINSWQQIASTDTMPTITFGVAAGDPVNTGATSIFTTANFPGASSTNLSDAATLYAILTGRVSSISKQLVLDEKSKQYASVAPIDRNRMREYGVYVQDTWRAARNLTINLGLRYEKEGAFENLNGLYSRVGLDSLWGVSGIGNLFKPGTLTGVTPTYKAAAGDPYSTPAQWAPSVGLAWQVPKMEGFLGKVFGNHEGGSVLRVGYSISTVREGQNLFINIWGSNQGITQTASVSNANTPADFGAAGSVLFRGNLPTKSGLVTTPTYPIPASFSTSLNDFIPNLKLGYVQSWNIGWQRELGRDMVVEARYTGNHGVHLWRQYNLDEVNIVENGFLNEFKIAQNNLRIARGGDITRNTGVVNFGNTGLAGQQAIPILSTAIGSTSDTTTATQLMLGQAGAAAQAISSNSGRMTNLTKAGYPVNMFVVNPTVAGNGAFIVTNDGSSYYDAAQVELRRRMSHGFTIQGSYVFSKSLANGPTNSSTSSSQPTTLRNLSLDKTPSGFDLRHALKANWIYELPFGSGRRFLGNGTNTIVRKAFEGWQISSVLRVQSGLPFFLTGLGTFNQNTSDGITLNNLTSSQLQQMVNIRKTTGADGRGIVYFLPQSLIDNSMAAFNVGGKTPADVDPTKPYIGPAATGQLGWRGYLYQNWNRFYDVSLIKRTRIRESINMELRATALNVFNLTNFGTGASGTNYNNIGSAFGQVSGAYRDISGTVEPGGRILEFMVRVNF